MTSISERTNDFTGALLAVEHHAELGDEAETYGRFIGSWHGEYRDASVDGQIRTGPMEVHFLDAPRLGRVHLKQPLDIGGHALVDQIEQSRVRLIEAVVEVENPVADVGEARVHVAARALNVYHA